jgi:hypothetical protein
MQPINFDNHCAACHPLQVQTVLDKKQNYALEKAATAFNKQPIAHPKSGENVSTVQALLRDRFLDFALKNAGLLKLNQILDAEPERPLAGHPHTQSFSKDEWQWAQSQLDIAAKRLFSDNDGCKRCHDLKLAADPKSLPDLGKPSIPSRWLGHSVFSHKSHQMLNCADCHIGAHASAKTSDVLMPKIATCQSCHSPSAGARSDCVECHKFHQHP